MQSAVVVRKDRPDSVIPLRLLSRMALLVAVFLVLEATYNTGRADAYTHRWSCPGSQVGSGARCWDYSGVLFNPWVEVENNMWSGQTHPQVCAKGQTDNGSTRNGSGTGCALGANYRKSCFGYELPQTQAYIYYIRNDQVRYSVDGRAETPASRTC